MSRTSRCTEGIVKKSGHKAVTGSPKPFYKAKGILYPEDTKRRNTGKMEGGAVLRMAQVVAFLAIIMLQSLLVAGGNDQ